MEPKNGTHRPKRNTEKKLKEFSYIFGPWHPAINSFPIVCSILANFALWLGNTNDRAWLLQAAGILWILTFIGGLFSLLTGHLFAHRLERYTRWSPLPPTSTGPLHFHALLATIALGLSLVMLPGDLALLRDGQMDILGQFFLGIACAVFFAWSAHEGGEMTFHIEMVPLSGPENGNRSIHSKPGTLRTVKNRKPHPRMG